MGAGGCCTSANFFDPHPALIKITGGIVGGPDQSDNFPDKREDYQRSEVALDYNAGFTGAVAGLAFYAENGDLSACGAGRLSASCCVTWLHPLGPGLLLQNLAPLCTACEYAVGDGQMLLVCRLRHHVTRHLLLCDVWLAPGS